MTPTPLTLTRCRESPQEHSPARMGSRAAVKGRDQIPCMVLSPLREPSQPLREESRGKQLLLQPGSRSGSA